MKTLAIILSMLFISHSICAVDITCEADPKSGVAFPEKPFSIKLEASRDLFSLNGEEEKYELEPSKEDRLKWNFFVPFFEINVDFDIRNQRVLFYDDEGNVADSVSMICKNIEEAEQEWISNTLILPGKLEAAGYSADLMVDDSKRGFVEKPDTDLSDEISIPNSGAEQR